jgi:hypothetical protein
MSDFSGFFCIYKKLLFSMKNVYKIIKEEIINYLREIEDNDDVDWKLYELLDEMKEDILYGFLNDKKNGIKHQPWTLIPFNRLKKIWEDYMTLGHIRDTRGLEMVEDIVTKNILKLYVNTELVGHTSANPDYDFDEHGYTEQDKEDFFDYVDDNFSDYAFNDFHGSRLGLTTLLAQLRRVKTPEEKVVIIDQILNVIHQRSDLAGRFVEGGSHALSQLSGSPSEVSQ